MPQDNNAMEDYFGSEEFPALPENVEELVDEMTAAGGEMVLAFASSRGAQ